MTVIQLFSLYRGHLWLPLAWDPLCSFCWQHPSYLSRSHPSSTHSPCGSGEANLVFLPSWIQDGQMGQAWPDWSAHFFFCWRPAEASDGFWSHSMRPPQGILLELLGKETLSAISFLNSWRCLETIWPWHRGSLLEEDTITEGDPMEREVENQTEVGRGDQTDGYMDVYKRQEMWYLML